MQHKLELFQLTFQTENLFQFSELIIKMAKKRQYVTVLPTTMNEIVCSKKNLNLKEKIKHFDYLTFDGMPLLFLAKIKALKKISRVYGPDLMEQIFFLGQKKNLKHFLYGTSIPTLHKLTQNLHNKYPYAKITGSFSPPFRVLTSKEKNNIVKLIKQSKPDIVWVSLGGEKQIQWIDEFFPKLDTTCIAVGAAFDFISGVKQQAPKPIRNYGFEWLFRLVTEPKRLWRRYILHFPITFWLFLKEFCLIIYAKTKTS